jgi:3-hydroxybutyryl-CoA dehydrogenase
VKPSAGEGWPRIVAVVGGGYMGRGIAEVLALAGARCVLSDVSEERATAALDALLEDAARHERDELVPDGSAERLRTLVGSAASVEEAVAGADYVVEAVFEERAAKEDVLRRIEREAGANVPVATNTSAIPIASLSRVLARPERFLGAHWFNPPQFVPAVELVACPETSPEVMDAVEAFLVRAGKRPTRVGDSPGFVANRLQYALFQEAAAVVEEGVATPEEVDEIVRGSFGFRLPFFGPFAIADMAGLDVYGGAYRVLHEAYGDRFTPPRTLTEPVTAGRLGAKTGSGIVIQDARQAEVMAAGRDRSYVALRRLVDRSGRAAGQDEDADSRPTSGR